MLNLIVAYITTNPNVAMRKCCNKTMISRDSYLMFGNCWNI